MGKLTVLIPIALGITAGLLNFLAVQSAIKPVDFVAAAKNLKSGQELSEDSLVKVSIRVRPTLLKSAVPWADRGILVGRRVGREISEEELILFADVRQPGADALTNLRPGEVSITVLVPTARLVPGVRIGDEVLVLTEEASDGSGSVLAGSGGGRLLGPFRVIGLGARPDGLNLSSKGPDRQIVLALKVNPDGTPADAVGRQLQAALKGAKEGKVQAVEYPGPGSAR